MNDLDINDIDWIDFGSNVARDPEKLVRCGWRSKASQTLRFKVLAKEIRSNESVLDVGCGTGDFFQYIMLERDLPLIKEYTGTDLSSELITIAKQRYAEYSAEFMTKDILKHAVTPETRKFDVVVASGIFTLRKYRSLEYLDAMITRMMELSNRVVAFNLLSTFADDIQDSSRYYSPSEAIMLMSRHTHKFKLLHDYAPHDFTCVLYK